MIFLTLLISTSLVFGNENDDSKKVFINQRIGSVNRSQLMPNFFFFGVSKCGTSTMAALLTEHPLITAIGTERKIGGESRTLQKANLSKKVHNMRTDRVVKHLLSTKNDSLIEDILKRGCIMDYTPNYAQNEFALQNTFNSVQFFDHTENFQNKKFLMMIRNPVTRTASSWWFKEWISSGSTNAPFGPMALRGMKQESKLRNCYISNGFNISDVVKTKEGIDKLLQSNVMDKCKLQILNTNGYGERRQHIGKSLYAHTLVHMMQKIPLQNIYIMTMDSFIHNSALEVDLLLKWLSVPTYGEFGFKNAQEVNQRAKDIHKHSDPIDPAIFAREVLPWQSRLESFFRSSIIDLQNILGTFVIQQIESSSLQQRQTGMTSSSTFLQLTSLAQSKSGNWSDVVELLSVLHSTHFRH